MFQSKPVGAAFQYFLQNISDKMNVPYKPGANTERWNIKLLQTQNISSGAGWNGTIHQKH